MYNFNKTNMDEISDKELKPDNKWLLEKQLETLQIFYDRKLLTKEQYEFEVQTLKTKIKTDLVDDSKY